MTTNDTKRKSDERIKFAAILHTLIENSPFKQNRKPIWEALGVTSAAMSQYLQGQARPRWETLIDLAEFFDVSLDHLILGSDSMRKPIGDDRSIARYIDLALANVQNRTDAKTWLMARIGDALVDRIEDAANEALTRVSALSGVVTDDDMMLLESFSQETCLLLTYIDYNIIDVGVNAAVAGRFASIVAANLRARPMRPYSFLLPAEGVSEWEGKVERFRYLLSSEFGISKTRLAHCKFRFTEHGVMSGSGFYKLDVAGMRQRMPSLFCVLEPYLDESNWMGYIMHPNEETKGDMLFDRKHLKTARRLWDELWRNADPID